MRFRVRMLPDVIYGPRCANHSGLCVPHPAANAAAASSEILTTSFPENSGHLSVALLGRRSSEIPSPAKERMIGCSSDNEVELLRRAGHTWKEIDALSGVSVWTLRRIAAKADITTTKSSTASSGVASFGSMVHLSERST